MSSCIAKLKLGLVFFFGSFLSLEEIESELGEGEILDAESKLPALTDILGCCVASFEFARIPFGDLGWRGEEWAGPIDWISGSTGVAGLEASAILIRPIGLAGFVSDRFALVFGLVGEEVGVEVVIGCAGWAELRSLFFSGDLMLSNERDKSGSSEGRSSSRSNESD